jgi:putative phosphoribosyl transferase
VLGLPRGGVPVAFEVAAALKAPLDVCVVRKVGAPGSPEFGVGAVAEGGIVFLNQRSIDLIGASREEIEAIVRTKSAEVEARVKLFRGGAAAPRLQGKTILLVDDGIATGGTVRAAVEALRLAEPAAIVLAVPVAASQSLDELRPLFDDVVCVHSTPALHSIGAWYDDFEQVPDEEVIELLNRARGQGRPPRRREARSFAPREVSIPLGGGSLSGTLSGPQAPKGLVLFAHGSGSSRSSPRNRHVASALHRFGLATLLFDLLTRAEEQLDQETAELRFDIALLASRLVRVTDWVLAAPQTHGLPLGYFGASTGAAAALVAAAERPSEVSAVVSRGGRPDLAWESLPRVRCPTLLIVGGEDHQVIELNEAASARLSNRRLVIVPGATHLFEEPGTLDAVARLAGAWFEEHLGRAQHEAHGAGAPG